MNPPPGVFRAEGYTRSRACSVKTGVPAAGRASKKRCTRIRVCFCETGAHGSGRVQKAWMYTIPGVFLCNMHEKKRRYAKNNAVFILEITKKQVKGIAFPGDIVYNS